MKRSTELEILIESIKVCLLEKDSSQLTFLLNKKVNWVYLEKMAVFHAIRPIVYDACQKANFKNQFTQNLKNFTYRQAIINLGKNQELSRLLTLLQSQQIRVLPYKGFLFTLKLYQNKQIRETKDLDLLIHPNDVRRALNILLIDGYKFDINGPVKFTSDEIIEHYLDTFGFIEIDLYKISDMGIAIYIDLHWRLFEEYHNYKIDYTDFFTNQPIKEQNNQTIINPSTETLFLMLLNHHGGRECWLRLKGICDLILFLKTYEHEFDFKQLLDLSTKVEMKLIFETGFSIYQSHFLEYTRHTFAKKHEDRILKSSNLIINYWEESELWRKLNLRIRYEYIYIRLQDDTFSLKKYFLNPFLYFSKPNLKENRRLITFPENFRMLNFISKVITFIWKKTFKKFFKATSL